MPRFELNPRTGMMEPKKDDQIYFAGSMGGGLRIDDHKNNVKYVIERDGRITNIAGIRDEMVNLYDMRDARIIADRVVRMFGRSHKYSDFHYFLKGYRVSEGLVKDFDEFVNEDLFHGSVIRTYNQEVKKEDGFAIGVLEDGTKLIMPSKSLENGSVVEFDGKNFYYFEDTDDYIVVINNGDEDHYYRYDPNEESIINVVECFTAGTKLRDNDFEQLIAYMKCSESVFSDLDGLEVDFGHRTIFGNGNEEWEVWDDEDKVQKYAIEREEDILEDTVSAYTNALNNTTTFIYGKSREDIRKRWRETLDGWRNTHGNSFIDTKSIENDVRKSYESSFDDMESDDLINDLIRYNLIKDTEEYFELDEDGEIDHDLPKFDFEDYKDDYVDYIMNQIDDVVDEYLLNYGYDGFEEYIDLDKLAELNVERYGRGSIISSYDGEEGEETINGTTYYIYRIN